MLVIVGALPTECTLVNVLLFCFTGKRLENDEENDDSLEYLGKLEIFAGILYIQYMVPLKV